MKSAESRAPMEEGKARQARCEISEPGKHLFESTTTTTAYGGLRHRRNTPLLVMVSEDLEERRQHAGRLIRYPHTDNDMTYTRGTSGLMDYGHIFESMSGRIRRFLFIVKKKKQTLINYWYHITSCAGRARISKCGSTAVGGLTRLGIVNRTCL